MSAAPVDEIVTTTTGTVTLGEAARLLAVDERDLRLLVRALGIRSAGEIRTPGQPGKPPKTYRLDTLIALVDAVTPFAGVM